MKVCAIGLNLSRYLNGRSMGYIWPASEEGGCSGWILGNFLEVILEIVPSKNIFCGIFCIYMAIFCLISLD